MIILVTGASGLLGRAVCKELQKHSHFETIGIAYSRARKGLKKINLLIRQEIDAFVKKVKPHCIIHCAAIRNPDICEKNPGLTKGLNINSTKWLANAASKLGSWMIYISSDYVFDGIHPPYHPNSQTNPINAYGKSKFKSEIIVKKILKDYCILRLPILYGDVEFLEESPVTTIVKRLLIRQKQKIDNWSTRYPTHTNDVAFVLRQIIEYKINNPIFSGICHWSNNEPYTKYEMACIMCDIINVPRYYIEQVNNPVQGVVRPQNTHLDCSLLESLGMGKHTKFKKGIADSIKPFI